MCPPPALSQPVEPVRRALVLHNNLDELRRLALWVNEQADQLGLSQKLAFRLDLVLTEAVTNIVQYAFADDGQAHPITITLHWSSHHITVDIEDDGHPFNPLQSPQVALPTSLDQAGYGGLGIHLIRRYADKCNYYRRQNKNILTIRLNEAKA